MNPFLTIRIHGVDYAPDNLDSLLLNWKSESDWILPIHQFLSDWFSDGDYMEVKTSGSTGIPKTIRVKKMAMVHSAKATCTFLELTNTDSALLCLSANFIAGKMMLVRALVKGFSIRIVPPAANPFIHQTEVIDFVALSPYQLAQSIDTLKERDVRKIIVGGAPVSAKLKLEIQDLSADIYETFGMTETISHIALRKINGSGRSEYFQVLPGIEIGQDDRQCLSIKAPLLFDGELVTNDIITMEGNMAFKWLGRFDNVINSGGIKIHPEMVERKLEGIISSKFMIGSLLDEKLGERVILVIEGIKPDEKGQSALQVTLSALLERYEIPREIKYVPAFPVSVSGKFNRKNICI